MEKAEDNSIPDLDYICQSHKRISPFIHRTPVLTSSLLNQYFKSELFFKCENFQKVGAFKFRGATNAVQSLSVETLKNGVCTHSSGNHAAALALAAKMRGVKAYIVMPENAPQVKIAAVKSYGAEIVFCKPTLEAREETLESVKEKHQLNFIHPYNNFDIIAGQGTASLELIDTVPDLDYILTPVGGGGLLSGTSIVSKSKNKHIQVIAGEPFGADDAYQSFRVGKIIPSVNPKTIADGLLTSLGSRTFLAISNYVDDIIRVSEKQIVQAMRLIWERMKIIIEPSSAVALAVLLESNDRFRNKKTGIILSGGNVELSKLPF